MKVCLDVSIVEHRRNDRAANVGVRGFLKSANRLA
jgi:hypothetical protein